MQVYCFKYYWFIGFFCAAMLLMTTQASAQLTKEEKKFWKKERRKLTPEKLKSLMEEKKELESRLQSIVEENDQLKKQGDEQEQQIVSLNAALNKASEQLKAREIELGIINEQGERLDEGVVFKVQIGAFNEYDFSHLVGSSPNMDVEENNGLKQYVLGNFRDYDQADALKKHLRKVGVSNAWIAPYRDGKRVPLKEVLGVVID